MEILRHMRHHYLKPNNYVTTFVGENRETRNFILSLRSPRYISRYISLRLKRRVCKCIPFSFRRFADKKPQTRMVNGIMLIIPSNGNNVSFVWKPEFYCTNILQNSICGNQRDTIFALIYHATNIAYNANVEREQLEKRKQFLSAEPW